MPSMAKLPLVALGATLLAGCGGPAAARLEAGGGSQAPTPSAVRTCGGVDAPPCGQTPAPGSPRPTDDGAASKIPGACTLITRQDLIDVTSTLVVLDFNGDMTEDPPHDDSVADRGYTSVCRQALTSTFHDAGGSLNHIGGSVIVRIQTGGRERYFPPQAGDTVVTGLGDAAMTRNATLYVESGPALLIIDIGIVNPGPDVAAIVAQRLAWAKQLAPRMLDRLNAFQH